MAARFTGVPFLTSWYKGFREQNVLKRVYNSVMVRGERVIAVSDQIAELINSRYATPWERIAVVPISIDVERFDPAAVSPKRIEAVRHAWGAPPNAKVILVVGRMLRRKGHHVVVQAVRRLKASGLKDFLFVFVGEDEGQTRYTGELWDLVLASNTADVIRMAGRRRTCRRRMPPRLSRYRRRCSLKGCSARSWKRRPWRCRSSFPTSAPAPTWSWRRRR